MAELETDTATEQATRQVADATVVILAYSLARWELDCAAVESALGQTLAPAEIMLCVDDNADRPQLLERFRERWPQRPGEVPTVRIVESRSDAERSTPTVGRAGWRFRAHYGFRGTGISSGRTTCLALAQTEFLVFLDDDAVADPDWLARLLAPFEDPSVVAVGGAPLPVYAKPRPRWFPAEFDWVFGCAYEGLPKRTASVLRLIGANMAMRCEQLRAIGGVGSMEDMEICHRLLQRSPGSKLIYEPRAIVRHRVHEDRLAWGYFWRRCFWANRDKVAIMYGLGDAGNLKADRSFIARSLSIGVARGLRDFVTGDVGGLQRALSIIAGIGVSAVGYLTGLVEWHATARSSRSSTTR